MIKSYAVLPHRGMADSKYPLHNVNDKNYEDENLKNVIIEVTCLDFNNLVTLFCQS